VALLNFGPVVCPRSCSSVSKNVVASNRNSYKHSDIVFIESLTSICKSYKKKTKGSRFYGTWCTSYSFSAFILLAEIADHTTLEILGSAV